MSQQRIQDFGSPVVAQSLKTLANSTFGKAAVLSGNSFIAEAANRMRINPGTAITNQGVIIIEDEAKTLEIENTSLPQDYTVFYSHVDEEISGGIPAVLTRDSGLLTGDVVDGVILGYVRYPGGGVPLAQSHFVQAPPLKVGQEEATVNNGDWLVPIRNQGYLVTTTSGAAIDITDNFDTSGSKPEMFVKFRNNDTVTGTVVITFPFKVKDLPYAILQMIIATDINGVVTATFYDSEGTAFIMTPSLTGEVNFDLKTLQITREAVQTPNTLVYLQLEIGLAAAREVNLQALGLHTFNLPV